MKSTLLIVDDRPENLVVLGALLGGSYNLIPAHSGREALELDALKAAARQRVTAALEFFGQKLWQNPNLQANCFLLAEATAWLKAADSTLGRLAWISRQQSPDESAEPSPRLELGRRAFARCCQEVRDRLLTFLNQHTAAELRNQLWWLPQR